jgi:hypothetical protein
MTTKVPSPTEWLRLQTKKIGTQTELAVDELAAAAVRVESWLQELGVEYAKPTWIPMALIDEKRSRQNQARKDPIVADSVDRFASAMRAGKPFPPIVAYSYNGRLVIIDGNNRQAGARKAGLEQIYGIVISEQTSSELIQFMTVSANRAHGVTPDVQWRLRQAFHLVGLGFSDAQAAEAASVTVQQISNTRRLQAADQRARALKIPHFTDLPATSRAMLNSLKDEKVFEAAATVAARNAMNIEDIRDLIRDVKVCKSEADRLEVINRVAQERGIEEATRKVAGKTLRTIAPKQSLVAAIGMISKIDETALAQQILTTHDRELLAGRLRVLVDKILAIQVALEALEPGEES